MRFTMARPEVSCHPETLLEGARTVVSAALCYWHDLVPAPGRGEAATSLLGGSVKPTPLTHRRARPLPRYTWFDAYAVLRERLDELGRRLGGEYRVLVDANQHVDREAAARSGVGFYGKNTMLITRRYGSWVVLGTLVTDVELEPTPPLDADCGSCTLCIDACPTGALDEPGSARRDALPLVLDAGCRADPGGLPRGARRPGLRLRHLPGRLPLEPRRREAPRRARATAGAEPHVSLVDWLEASDEDLADALRPAVRPAQRPALPAPERARRARQLGQATRGPARRYAEGDDPLLREHAEWALDRLEDA